MSGTASFIRKCDSKYDDLTHNVDVIIAEIDGFEKMDIDDLKAKEAEIVRLQALLNKTKEDLQNTEALRDTCAASLEAFAAMASSEYKLAQFRVGELPKGSAKAKEFEAQLIRLRDKNVEFENELQELEEQEAERQAVESQRLAELEEAENARLMAEEQQRQIEENARLSAAIAQSLSQPGGFGVFIRIRCQNAKEGQTVLKADANSVAIENHKVETSDNITIWNDNKMIIASNENQITCAKLKELQFLQEKQLIDKENRMFGTISGNARDQVQARFLYYYKLVQLVPIYAAIKNRIDEIKLQLDDNFRKNTGYKLYEEYEKEKADLVKKYNSTPARVKEIDELKTDIKNMEIAEQYLISSGNEIIGQKDSVLNFLQEDEFPSTVTIFAIGGSGSGKTTSARSILQHIYFKYMERINPPSEIQISYSEVYQHTDNKIYVLKLPYKETTPTKIHIVEEEETKSKTSQRKTPEQLDAEKRAKLAKRGFLKPHLVYRKTPNEFSGQVKLFPVDDMKDFEQMKMAAWCNMLEYDAVSDKYRQTQYTPNNPTGSSRSIKITTVEFNTNGVKNRVNLVDTCGFENYTIEELNTFFAAQIASASIHDEKYILQVADEAKMTDEERKKKSIIFPADYLAHRVLQQGVFIKNSLDYIRDSVVAFRHAQELPLQAHAEGDVNWIEREKLITDDCSVLVVGAFKHNIPPKEAQAGIDTIDFLNVVAA